MPDLQSLLRVPDFYLIFAVLTFSLGVVWTCTGKAKVRFGWFYRAQEPISFWFAVAIYYLLAAC